MGLLSDTLRGVMNEAADDLLFKMTKDRYTDNLLSMISVVKRVGFFPAMELWMRATQGEVLERPLGTNLHLSHWEELLLNPVHLHRLPVEDTHPIDQTVVIGPAARRPLHLQIPVMITGMSYGGALSQAAKIALAKAASQLGTATNTGESGFLPEEREAATRLIGQYNRGGYLNTPERYKEFDAIEIQLGQGAQGSSPQRTQAKFIDKKMAEVYGLGEGEDAVLHTRIPGINSERDFEETVGRLKEETGVPVGVKFAASHWLEQELEVAVRAGVDFVVVDGAEGATHAASPTTEDDLGLPTMYAIARARRFLEAKDYKDRVTLIGSGGLFTPGQFLKALALGADALYIGTAPVLALIAPQVEKVTPTEPPTQLILHTGRLKDQFDPELGAESVVNYLDVCIKEMNAVLYSLGKPAVRELAREDLCCVDPFLARSLGVDFAGVAPGEQENYFRFDTPLSARAERREPALV